MDLGSGRRATWLMIFMKSGGRLVDDIVYFDRFAV